MLSIIRRGTRITLKLTGRIEGSSAEDLRMAVCPPSALDIDLTGVTAIDQDGERALAWLRDRGARFHGEGPFARKVCERMHLSPDIHNREEGAHEKVAQLVSGKRDGNLGDWVEHKSEVTGESDPATSHSQR